jgi:hypothetical protein
MNSFKQFTQAVELSLSDNLSTSSVIKELICARRFPLHDDMTHICRYSSYLSEIASSRPSGFSLFESGSLGELLQLDLPLIELFERYSKPCSTNGGTQVLFNRPAEIYLEAVHSLSEEDLTLIAVPYTFFLESNGGGRTSSLGELLGYFNADRFIAHGSVYRATECEDLDDETDTSIIFYSGTSSREVEFRAALGRLIEEGIGVIQLWTCKRKKKTASLQAVFYPRPYCPVQKAFFPLPERELLANPDMHDQFVLNGMSLKALINCALKEVFLWQQSLLKSPLSRELAVRLHPGVFCKADALSLQDSVLTLSHGQRELFSLTQVVDRSLCGFEVCLVGEFQRYDKNDREVIHQKLEDLKSENIVLLYESSPDYSQNQSPALDVPKIKCRVKGFECEENTIEIEQGFAVLAGTFQSGKTTLLRNELQEASWRTVDNRHFSIETLYRDFSTPPLFLRSSCGSATKIIRSVAEWYASLPESRRKGLGVKDFIQHNTAQADAVQYRGATFRNVCAMTFQNVADHFSESDTVLYQARLLTELGLGALSSNSPAGELFGSVRKKLHIVTTLAILRERVKRVVAPSVYSMLLADELFSGLPVESVTVLTRELLLLREQRIFSIVSSCFRELYSLPGTKLLLTFKNGTYKIDKVDQ